MIFLDCLENIFDTNTRCANKSQYNNHVTCLYVLKIIILGVFFSCDVEVSASAGHELLLYV